MRRSWLFVAGADEAAHEAAGRSGADVIILELEDFTPPELRPKARAHATEVLDRWRGRGALAGVRINPLESGGREDLLGVLAGRPDFIMMSKVVAPEQVKALEAETGGAIELIPNIESAMGLLRTFDIARSSPRVSALLIASEDMVADLGTERSRGGAELAYVRSRFLVECRAAGSGGDRLSVHLQRPEGGGGGRALRAPPRLPHEEPGRSRARSGDQQGAHPGPRPRTPHRRRVRKGARSRQGARQARRRAHRGAGVRRGEAPARVMGTDPIFLI